MGQRESSRPLLTETATGEVVDEEESEDVEREVGVHGERRRPENRRYGTVNDEETGPRVQPSGINEQNAWRDA